MTNRTVTTAILAITLALPAAAVFADQPFGRDSVYGAASGAGVTARSAAVRNDAQPFGRESVSAARIPGSGQVPASTAQFEPKPGRA